MGIFLSFLFPLFFVSSKAFFPNVPNHILRNPRENIRTQAFGAAIAPVPRFLHIALDSLRTSRPPKKRASLNRLLIPSMLPSSPDGTSLPTSDTAVRADGSGAGNVGAAQPSMISCLSEPAIQSEFQSMKIVLQAAGVSEEDGPISCAAFKQEFEQLTIETPITDIDMVPKIQRRIRARAIAVIEAHNLLMSVRAKATKSADAAGASSYSAGHTVSEVTSTSKRRSADGEDEDETAAAAAAAASQGIFKVEDSWPRDVKCMMPEFGAAILAVRELTRCVDEALGELYDISDPASKISRAGFADAPLRVDPHSAPEALVRDKLQALVSLSASLHHNTLAARAQMKRLFDIYKLATQTQRASWLTVEQLQFREQADARARVFDDDYVPLTSWSDKVHAALVACEQTEALSEDGTLLGPVAPGVAALLSRGGDAAGNKGNSGPQRNPNARRSRRKSVSPVAGGGAKKKSTGGGGATTAGGGGATTAGGGVNKISTAQGGRKQTKGSAAATTTAAAAARPGGAAPP